MVRSSNGGVWAASIVTSLKLRQKLFGGVVVAEACATRSPAEVKNLWGADDKAAPDVLHRKKVVRQFEL